MRVKAVDIARGLGISKATVSLALNNRPGVSDEKRREIFAYKKKLENSEQISQALAEEGRSEDNPLEEPKVIMVVMASKEKQVAINSELDLWTDVLAALQRTAGKSGFETQVMYVNILQDDLERVNSECSSERVAGVLLAATELDDGDFSHLRSIVKPLIVYDNEAAETAIGCVVPNNTQGLRCAVQYLLERDMRDIIYLANSGDIYNFQKRREGFALEMTKHRIDIYSPERIVTIGRTINEVDENMTAYLESHALPQAFITENYQVTIGVTRALRRKGIQLPEDVSLIGVDKLPSYMTGDVSISCVCVPQAERAVLAMQILLGKIKYGLNEQAVKCNITVNCTFEEGDSVRH